MNPVEIEEAVNQLAGEPFDTAEFPFQFLAAFVNKKTTIDRLRRGNTNQSGDPAGLLQRNNIHLAVCGPSDVPATRSRLRESPILLARDTHVAGPIADFYAPEAMSEDLGSPRMSGTTKCSNGSMPHGVLATTPR